MLPGLGGLERLSSRIPCPFAEHIFRTRFGESRDKNKQTNKQITTIWFFSLILTENGDSSFFQADQEIPKMSAMNDYDVDGMPLEDPELDGAPLSDSEDLDGN